MAEFVQQELENSVEELTLLKQLNLVDSNEFQYYLLTFIKLLLLNDWYCSD